MLPPKRFTMIQCRLRHQTNSPKVRHLQIRCTYCSPANMVACTRRISQSRNWRKKSFRIAGMCCQWHNLFDGKKMTLSISILTRTLALVLGLFFSSLALSANPQPPEQSTARQALRTDTKERIVLMPLRLGEEDKSRQAAMEVALLEGLQQKYEVFSGEVVAKKARAIFLKESRNTTHTECDEIRCLQNIAEAFQAELLAIASVSKQADGYFIALSIQNIFDNKVVYSKSTPCKNCDAYQVVEKLKEISGAGANTSNTSRSLGSGAWGQVFHYHIPEGTR